MKNIKLVVNNFTPENNIYFDKKELKSSFLSEDNGKSCVYDFKFSIKLTVYHLL